jgi:hypothetical protein
VIIVSEAHGGEVTERLVDAGEALWTLLERGTEGAGGRTGQACRRVVSRVVPLATGPSPI